MKKTTIIPTTKGPITNKLVLKNNPNLYYTGGTMSFHTPDLTLYLIQIGYRDLFLLWQTQKNLTVMFEYIDSIGNTTYTWYVKTQNLCTNQIQPIIERLTEQDFENLTDLKIYIYIQFTTMDTTSSEYETIKTSVWTFNYNYAQLTGTQSMNLIGGNTTLVNAKIVDVPQTYTYSISYGNVTQQTGKILFNTTQYSGNASWSLYKYMLITAPTLTKVVDIIFADSIENLISNTQTKSISTFTYKNKFTSTGTQNYPNNDVNFIFRIQLIPGNVPQLYYYVLFDPTTAITSTSKNTNIYEFATWLTPSNTTRTKYAFYLKTQSGKIQFMVENNPENAFRHSYTGHVQTPYSPNESFTELNNLI